MGLPFACLAVSEGHIQFEGIFFKGRFYCLRNAADVRLRLRKIFGLLRSLKFTSLVVAVC
jgi:hypothetical protein